MSKTKKLIYSIPIAGLHFALWSEGGELTQHQLNVLDKVIALIHETFEEDKKLANAEEVQS